MREGKWREKGSGRQVQDWHVCVCIMGEDKFITESKMIMGY